jgi:hypothetical protein
MYLETAMKRVMESVGTDKSKGLTIVREAFKTGEFNKRDFSIKRLALETMGADWVEDLTPKAGLQMFKEQVDSSTFLNLANVVLTGTIIDEFAQADINAGDQFAETRTVPYIQSGRDIGLTRTDAKSVVVGEGQPFPSFGMGEDWRLYPDTVKRGAMVELTKEAIAEDRTGQLLQNCQGVAEEVVTDKNERILRVVLGIDNSVYLPKGVATATYATTAGRKNLLTGTELVDWTDVDDAVQLWADMTHPVTGRPINVPLDQISVLVMPQKLATISHIFQATEVTVGDVTSGSTAGVRRGGNPINYLARNVPKPSASQLAYYMLTKAAALGGGGIAASDAKKYWYMGAFTKAFVYLQNYGLTVLTQGATSEAAFQRDVVFAMRASERGVPAVKDPRFVLQMNG